MLNRVGSWFVKKLDKDGDGKVTIDEVEEMVEDANNRIRKTIAPVQGFLQKYRWTAELGVGYVGCFYGGNFSHCFLCASAFQSAEGQAVVKNLKELQQITRESTKRFTDSLGADGAILVAASSGSASNDGSPSDDSVEIPSSTFMAILTSVEPDRISKCVRSCYTGLLVALCSAINDNAAKLGLGLTLGDRIATFLISIADRFMSEAEEKIALEDGSAAIEDNANDANADDSKEGKAVVPFNKKKGKKSQTQALAWTKLAIRGCASSLGVYISWKLKDMAATWSTCHWGGCKIATSFFELMAHEDAALQEMLGFGIGGLGFAYHLRHFNGPELPTVLKPILMPFTFLEAFLRGITLANNS
ncbi:unnamed protein product [Amoebophrya sp. A120]|nr:unnamed protein product [Amoebophrya sp. A120]|eukprot:GSA120T00005096001.1